LNLDATRLARTRSDTAIVSAMLGQIFGEDDATVASEDKAESLTGVPRTGPADETHFDGLDAKYAALLASLLVHDSLARKDFEAAASEHHVFCDGAIEAINDWSYNRFGDALLEDGDPVVVNRALVTSQQQAAA
jgi:hypothetical protein